MKVFEIINFNKELLLKMRMLNVRLDDVQYIDLYNQYCEIVTAGNKVSYAVAKLSEEYNVCERTVYDLLKRFEKDCNPIAVKWGGVKY